MRSRVLACIRAYSGVVQITPHSMQGWWFGRGKARCEVEGFAAEESSVPASSSRGGKQSPGDEPSKGLPSLLNPKPKCQAHTTHSPAGLWSANTVFSGQHPLMNYSCFAIKVKTGSRVSHFSEKASRVAPSRDLRPPARCTRAYSGVLGRARAQSGCSRGTRPQWGLGFGGLERQVSVDMRNTQLP